MTTYLRNAVICDKNGQFEGSILLNNGIIDQVLTVPDDSTIKADTIIDCEGNTLLPGFIDTHCHLRDPGLTYKEDIESGLKAAAKGGFTQVCAMANTVPVTDSKEKIEINLKKAEKVGSTGLIQVSSLTKDFGDELVDFDSISKVTPILSNDGHNVDDAQIMREGLQRTKDYDTLFIATHNEPESETVERDIEILKETDGRLHICHISLKKTLELIEKAKEEGLDITCEVTPHHLYASGLDYKVHPPFRSEEDRTYLIEGVKRGTIDCFGTDHAPHSQEDKENGSPGLINFETAFGMYNTVLQENEIPLERFSEMASYNPAKRLGLKAGEIKPGNPADLVLVDPNQKWEVKSEELISKSKNSPFIGKVLTGRVLMTLHDGTIIYNSEEC